MTPLHNERRSSDADPHQAPIIGLLECFRPGAYERVEQVLEECRRLGVRHLRTGLLGMDWRQASGKAWFDWLIPRLAREVDLLPYYSAPSPSPGIRSQPDLDWLETFLARYGEHLEWVELLCAPDWRHEECIAAAGFIRRHGKRVVWSDPRSTDPRWLRRICENGAVEGFDALGVQGFPTACQADWEDWETQLGRVQQALAGCGHFPEIWLTRTGYSTARHDERRQLRHFLETLHAPAARAYWFSLQDPDQDADPSTREWHSADEWSGCFGLKHADGTPKLLYRLWAEEGLAGVRETEWMTRPAAETKGTREERPALLTGGAGFVGTNLAERLLSEGRRVLIFDNLSRPGVERNLRGLRERYGDRVEVEVADVRDLPTLRRSVGRAQEVYHFAAQVAVTTSVASPARDFEVNARGTLNLLEAIRASDHSPPLLFTSTNKVYGGLEDVALRLQGQRYEPEDPQLRSRGIGEGRGLDFHSPYGCSKGAADQYVIDYARTFGLRAVVFRMSCIYGPHQFGTEDQGWVAHFLIQALRGRSITLYGDGMQVRDVLFVGDLVAAFLLARRRIETLSGQAFNIGGGPENTVSLLELLALIQALCRREPEVRFGDWRPGDQRYYVSDTARFTQATGWTPRVSVVQGVRRLWHWLQASGTAPDIPPMTGADAALTDAARTEIEELEGEELLTP